MFFHLNIFDYEQIALSTSIGDTQIHGLCRQNQRIGKYDSDHVTHHMTSDSCCSWVARSFDLPRASRPNDRPLAPVSSGSGVGQYTVSRCCRSVLSVGVVSRCCRSVVSVGGVGRIEIRSTASLMQYEPVSTGQHSPHPPPPSPFSPPPHQLLTHRYPFLQPV